MNERRPSLRRGELGMWVKDSAEWMGLRGRKMVSSYFLRVVGEAGGKKGEAGSTGRK
jgi:hypothetical protein